MRPLLLCALLAVPLRSAPPLAIVNGIAHQMEDGPVSTIPEAFAAGETVFFSFQVENYKVSPDDAVNLSAVIEAFDPKGVAVQPPVTAAVRTEVTPQDREWKPKMRAQIAIPPLTLAGTFRIVAKVTDELAGASATREFRIPVVARDVAESATLAVLNFGFYRTEDDIRALATPAYRSGDTVWARFDIAGYRYGPSNRVDVEFGVTVLSPSGKVLFHQPQAATEQSESFYPKRYLPNAFSLTIQPNTTKGGYTIAVAAKDNVGKQAVEQRATFTVE